MFDLFVIEYRQCSNSMYRMICVKIPQELIATIYLNPYLTRGASSKVDLTGDAEVRSIVVEIRDKGTVKGLNMSEIITLLGTRNVVNGKMKGVFRKPKMMVNMLFYI